MAISPGFLKRLPRTAFWQAIPLSAERIIPLDYPHRKYRAIVLPGRLPRPGFCIQNSPIFTPQAAQKRVFGTFVANLGARDRQGGAFP
jgi:hypothetical protein